MLKDNIFMYYFLKVKEQFISLHLIYIKHFMANNYLLNYWINEVHWGYNYLLVVILLLVISILLYRIRKLQKTIKKTNHSYRFSFDILDNLPFPIFVKDITNDSDTITGIKNQPLNPALAVKRPSDILIMKFTEKKEVKNTGISTKNSYKQAKYIAKKRNTPLPMESPMILLPLNLLFHGKEKRNGCWQPGGISHNSRIMKEN